METEEANLPDPSATLTTTTSSSSSSSSSGSDFHHHSQQDLVRHVRAALKRQRPLGTMQNSNLRPRRVLLPQRVAVVDSDNKPQPPIAAALKEDKDTQFFISQREDAILTAADRSSITPPSAAETITEDFIHGVINLENKPNVASSSHPISTGDSQKKVQFSMPDNVVSHRADEPMSTGMELLSSHMNSLALTELEFDAGEMPGDHDNKKRDLQQMEVPDIILRPDGGISSLLSRRNALMENAVQGKEIIPPTNQPSVAGSSCMTTISVHSKYAPALNSATYSSRQCQDAHSHMDIEPLEVANVKFQPISQGYPPQPSYSTYQSTSGMRADSSAAPTQMSISSLVATTKVKDHGSSKGQQGVPSKESNKVVDGFIDHAKGYSALEDKPTKEKGYPSDVTDVQSQAPRTKSTFTDVKTEPSKSDKHERAASSKGAPGPRKKNYDPDVFVKVNGKLYQKLGKIGSGGSSEVYKVISSDCTIYALKRIKLKGRDYSTAYGFCQEIEYLNKLKGKNNIIQLIDYEVTDRTLLEEVMKGSMSIKDARIRDDGYVYMVLEYGEIDLAHMLSQMWKEQESSNWTIDENWLRFYWQQILEAVNTIHEERIVHSDLKPANFLLVKGSLKLIDFGIAKAIMSDTTNIQRDSQVGTLSYMSPEAFMCSESDSNGNPIKCGRPSDIWSLGCILYQMVYGRTPFSEYKTFWAKFKVITDRNHKIHYEPVSNPWLLDLMRKCLAWERNDRWRIPQLLHHPFLVPPIALPQICSPQNQSFDLVQQIAETYGKDDQVLKLCSQLQLLLKGSIRTKSHLSTLRGDQYCASLSQTSSLWHDLQQHLANIEG